MAVSGGALPAAAAFLKAESPAQNPVFYDERFAEALDMAKPFAAHRRLTPVTSDVTALWRSGLDRLSRTSPLDLNGVTTESFYFCLKTLLQSQGGVDARIAPAANKDLYVWSIRTRTNNKTG